MDLKSRFQNVQETVQSLEHKDWWIKGRKIAVTGVFLLLIYYSATSIAASSIRFSLSSTMASRSTLGSPSKRS